MPTTYVIVDVETTGLDPQKDAIIEVAAVTLQGNAILEEYATLVNPHREIPPAISRLTGITDAMVSNAPTMYSVRSDLRPVLGDHVLVGHNVDFDLGFLNEERLGVGNHRLDTITLASILLPEAGRYDLESLARWLHLPLSPDGQDHRALEDANLTVELFLALQEKALELEFWQLEEIVQAGRRIAWPETLFFEEALAEKARLAFQDGRSRPATQRLPDLYRPEKPNAEAPVPREKPIPLDVARIARMLEPGGAFSQHFSGFEYRPQQVEMMTAVAHAFNAGEHTLVEAGTGTGKSVAYLLPAAFWAVQNGRRVVISTNTINLQDQLIHKDIPELQRVLPFELRAAVRKGRSNYLCTRLFQQMRHNGPGNADDMVLYARILLWLPHSQTGDVSEIALRTPGERQAWGKLNGENKVCTSDNCAQARCPLYITRMRAEQAHIVIVNHSLLLSDVANENHILPEFVDLIVDEAHHLEAAVTDGLSFRADKRSLETILDEITKPSGGLIGQLQSQTRSRLPSDLAAPLEAYIDGMRREAQEAGFLLEDFFTTVSFFLREYVNRRSQFAEQVRLITAVRAQPNYRDVELAWDNLHKSLKALATGFKKLAEALGDHIYNFDIENGEDLQRGLAGNGRDLDEIRLNLHQIISDPNPEMIYWAELFKDRLSLHTAPLHVGPLVEKHIFGALETVVLTSATMRTAGAGAWDQADFSYLRQRLHAHETTELAVGSPFDYENSTLLYLASDIPEPNQPGYQQYLERAIVDVAAALGGRTMVLFTAYGQLNQTAQAIEGPLSDLGISTLVQGRSLSRQQMMALFKQAETRAVLLGTRSFWEGIDVPGQALQCVIIAKLPFDVPSDPIFAARSETFDNSFFEYSVPEAVLRFRQGFGRLIRRGTDEGVVAILDKRVLTKRYGRLFLDALPPCTTLRQRTDRLGELTLRWLNRPR